jgi:hypothetical protein
MSRRSRPPRTRKSRNTDSPGPPFESTASVAPPSDTVEETGPRPLQAPVDELAALDAGWDELLV